MGLIAAAAAGACSSSSSSSSSSTCNGGKRRQYRSTCREWRALVIGAWPALAARARALVAPLSLLARVAPLYLLALVASLLRLALVRACCSRARDSILLRDRGRPLHLNPPPPRPLPPPPPPRQDSSRLHRRWSLSGSAKARRSKNCQN